MNATLFILVSQNRFWDSKIRAMKIESTKILYIKPSRKRQITRYYSLCLLGLNQHDENFQKEIENNMKTFLDFEDLEEQREFILNLSREKGIKICDFSLLNLNLKKYIF